MEKLSGRELHKPARKNFPKRYVFVRNVDDIWGADLVDMKKLTKQNDGFKYILMIIVTLPLTSGWIKEQDSIIY